MTRMKLRSRSRSSGRPGQLVEAERRHGPAGQPLLLGPDRQRDEPAVAVVRSAGEVEEAAAGDAGELQLEPDAGRSQQAAALLGAARLVGPPPEPSAGAVHHERRRTDRRRPVEPHLGPDVEVVLVGPDRHVEQDRVDRDAQTLSFIVLSRCHLVVSAPSALKLKPTPSVSRVARSRSKRRPSRSCEPLSPSERNQRFVTTRPRPSIRPTSSTLGSPCSRARTSMPRSRITRRVSYGGPKTRSGTPAAVSRPIRSTPSLWRSGRSPLPVLHRFAVRRPRSTCGCRRRSRCRSARPARGGPRTRTPFAARGTRHPCSGAATSRSRSPCGRRPTGAASGSAG